MRSNLFRMLLSGALVLPVCLTGVVTAFQFRETTSANGESLVANLPDDGVATENGGPPVIGESKDETPPAAPTVPDPAPAVDTDKVNEPAIPNPVLPPNAKEDRRAPVPDNGLVLAKNRKYFCRLTTDGLLPGRIQVVDGLSRAMIPTTRLTISFVQHGKIVSQTRPRIDGFFQASGLTPGNYAVCANGDDGTITFAAEILPPLPQNAKRRGMEDVYMEIESQLYKLQQPLPEEARDSEGFLQIDAVLVPARDVPAVARIILSNLMPRNGEPLAPARGIFSSRQRPVQRPVMLAETRQDKLPKSTIRNTMFQGAEKNAANAIPASWGTALKLPIFHLRPDSTIGGRLTRLGLYRPQDDVHVRIPLQAAGVYLVHNGVVVNQSAVDLHGRFRIGGVREGDYSFVAVGPEGVAAFGVTVVMPGNVEARREARSGSVRLAANTRFVQNVEADAVETDVDVDMVDPRDVIAFGPGFPPPMGPMGGFMGGAGGGGGGGAGIGGALGALALGGALGALLADNNNSSSNNGGGSNGGGGNPPASNGAP